MSAPTHPHHPPTTLTHPHTAIPVFNVTPVPMWLVNGSYLRLDCEAIGSPPPTITWLFNSDPITLIAVDCSSGSLTSDLVVCSNGSVIVTSVDISHEGLYTCVADNEVGVNQVSVLVDVGEASDDDVEGEAYITLPNLTVLDIVPV